MLAERARLPLAILVLAAASLAITVVAVRPCEPAKATASAIIVSELPLEGAVEISDFCPAYIRTSMHLGPDATICCVRGQFPEPGTFVFAQYRTTETWERFAVVADDGRLIVPMLDRPRR